MIILLPPEDCFRDVSVLECQVSGVSGRGLCELWSEGLGNLRKEISSTLENETACQLTELPRIVKGQQVKVKDAQSDSF